MEREILDFYEPSYKKSLNKKTQAQENYQNTRAFLSEYKDSSMFKKQGDMSPFLYYNASWRSRKDYNPHYYFKSLKIESEQFSNIIPNNVTDSKYCAIGLYANQINHDAFYKRIAYLQPQWTSKNLFEHTFNVTPINIYGEERKIGEFSLGLLYASPENSEVENIISELNKTNQNVTPYPVVREFMGKKYNATEIVFTHFNKSSNTADLTFYYQSLFIKYRTLAKELVKVTEERAPYNLLQFNGDFLDIHKSNTNYFAPPIFAHQIPNLISDENSEHKYRPRSKIIVQAVINNNPTSENTTEIETTKLAKKEQQFNQ